MTGNYKEAAFTASKFMKLRKCQLRPNLTSLAPMLKGSDVPTKAGNFYWRTGTILV